MATRFEITSTTTAMQVGITVSTDKQRRHHAVDTRKYQANARYSFGYSIGK